MKILFLMRKSKHYTNLFVPELCEQLRRLGHQVQIGMDLLEESNNNDFDIIHIHWPEYILPTNNPSITDIGILDIWLKKISNANIPIVVQCHNLKPHDVKNEAACRLYDIVYSHATAFVHMGRFSRNYLQSKYSNAIHVVIPHHIYDISHRFCYDAKMCKRELNIPENKICILSFGKFRNDEERTFYNKCRMKFQNDEVFFIAPGFFRDKLICRNVFKSIHNILKFYMFKINGINFTNEIVGEDVMEKYFTAADIVFIQRQKILNSGNLPMAFACGKIVVGPDVGNVGEILKETGNPVFDAGDSVSATKAIRAGIGLINKNLGFRNRMYARKHWTCTIVANDLIGLYTYLKNEYCK